MVPRNTYFKADLEVYEHSYIGKKDFIFSPQRVLLVAVLLLVCPGAVVPVPAARPAPAPVTTEAVSSGTRSVALFATIH